MQVEKDYRFADCLLCALINQVPGTQTFFTRGQIYAFVQRRGTDGFRSVQQRLREILPSSDLGSEDKAWSPSSPKYQY